MWRLTLKIMTLFTILLFFLSGCGINKAQESGINSKVTKVNGSLTYGYSLNNIPKFGIQAIYFINGKDGWTGGQGIILSTNDSSKNWSVEHTGSFNISAFDFINSIYGWAISDKSILRTTDGGKTWTELPDVSTDVTNIEFVTVKKGYGISNRELYVTSDGGQT